MLRSDGTPARIPFMRWSNVFSLDETEGIPAPILSIAPNEMRPVDQAAAIVAEAKMRPIRHVGFAALYSPERDIIQMPAPGTFRSPEDYHHTLFHE